MTAVETPRPAGGPARRLTPMNGLFLALPVSAGLWLAGIGGVWLFAAAGLGIVPLAGLIGKATAALTDRVGAAAGGLLNATFGNAAELIIAVVMLARGPDLFPAVKATLTGSIIGNLLLVFGASALAGGVRHHRQRFDRTAAGGGATLMAIAAAGLLLPTLFATLHSPAGPDPGAARRVGNLSEEIAAVLIGLYVLNLVFTLRTRAAEPPGGGESAGGPRWGPRTAVAVLLGATAAVAALGEWLVGAFEPAARAFGMNGVFVGVVVVAVVGNAAEHYSAVEMAMRDRMDVAVRIAVGSSTQIALFVAPVLVFVSLAMGHPHPLDLHFTRLEVVAVVLSVAVVALVSHDGETNWLEGAMLLALYLILALAFYNLPGAAG